MTPIFRPSNVAPSLILYFIASLKIYSGKSSSNRRPLLLPPPTPHRSHVIPISFGTRGRSEKPCPDDSIGGRGGLAPLWPPRISFRVRAEDLDHYPPIRVGNTSPVFSVLSRTRAQRLMLRACSLDSMESRTRPKKRSTFSWFRLDLAIIAERWFVFFLVFLFLRDLGLAN